MLTGTFQFFYRNGNLMEEFVFRDGYMLSSKTYARDGSLHAWIDYDIDYDGCLFSRHVQICRREKGSEWAINRIETYIDRRLGFFDPSYAWKAKRHDWKMTCEIRAVPIQVEQVVDSKIHGRTVGHATDALLIRPGQSAMPAYITVKLPRKECQAVPLRPSSLEMTLTHVDGLSVKHTPAVAVLPSSPFGGLRTRKSLLFGYFYFPLGQGNSAGAQAYDLSPGSYTMSIWYKEDESSSPVLIGSAPLNVYGSE